MDQSFDELSSVIYSFCEYFHERINTIGFSGTQIGGFKRNNNSKTASDSITKLMGCDLTIENFMVTTVKIFQLLAGHEFIEKEFHMRKESEFVFKFLTNMLKNGFKINNMEMNLDQKNSLRIIHSQLSCVFSDQFPERISTQISSQMDRVLNGNSILRRQSKEYSAARDDFAFVKLKRLIEKRDKNKHNAEIAKMHIEAGTAPMHLFVQNFPKPTIKNNEGYMDKFNEIIRSSQLAILNLDIENYSNEIMKIENEIHSTLEHFRSDEKYKDLNIDDVFVACQDIIQNDLKHVFKRSVNKAANCRHIPYTVKEFEHYFKPNQRNTKKEVQFDESSISQSSSFSGHNGSINRNRYRKHSRSNRSSSRNRRFNNHYRNNSNQRYFGSQRESRREYSEQDDYSFRQRRQKPWRNKNNDWN